MTDPSDPTSPTPVSVTALTPDQIQAQNQALSDLTTQQTAYNTAVSDTIDIGKLVENSFDALDKAMSDAGVTLGNINSLTQQQTEQFGLASSAIVKARVAFEGFAGVDYSGLSTATSQITDIKEALFSGGTAAADAAKLIDTLSAKAKSFGATQSQVNQAIKLGAPAVADLAMNMAVHADNMNRAQTAIVQMAGKTGNLGQVMGAAGKDLVNMNDVIEKQQQMLKLTRDTTQLSATQTEKWYNQLGLIPGALDSIVVTGGKAGETTSMLTAVIETATGTGRDQADVMKDLSTAFSTYGLVGEKALLFSTRMSDVSTRLKAPIESVTNALRGSAEAFKMFATGQESAASSAESLAKTLNTYGKALESTGLSATSAVEVASQLTNQVGKLSTGQLAYISQQTGGAGGLQGAAQETLKLQTDPGQVVKDAMATLQQQFGKIVTVQEAATSEAAASQNQKQTLLLQQLLGPLAKDQASANRLLEAMKNQGEGNPEAIANALKPTSVQDAAQQGMELQKRTVGILGESRNILEDIRDVGDRAAMSIQGRLNASTTPQNISLLQGRMKGSLSDHMQAARAAGGIQAADTAHQMQTGNIRTSTGSDTASTIKQTMMTLKDVPIALRANAEAVMNAARGGDRDQVKAEEETLAQMVRAKQQMAKQLEGNPDAQNKVIQDAMNTQGVLDSLTGIKNSTEATIRGQQLTPNQPGTGAASAVAPNAASAPGTLNVVGKITIDCPHCGRPTDSGTQLKVYQTGK